MRRAACRLCAATFFPTVSAADLSALPTNELLRSGSRVSTSLSLVPPPRWALEIPKRMQSVFRYEVKQPVHFLRAFLHPSYTSATFTGDTMLAMIPVGDAVVQHVLASVLSGGSAASSQLLSAETLSGVLKAHGVDDLILTDVVVGEFERNKRRARGTSRSAAPATLPVAYLKQCLLGVVGAVFYDNGLAESERFVLRWVLPLAVELVSVSH